jgi:hypothetical protein
MQVWQAVAAADHCSNAAAAAAPAAIHDGLGTIDRFVECVDAECADMGCTDARAEAKHGN